MILRKELLSPKPSAIYLQLFVLDLTLIVGSSKCGKVELIQLCRISKCYYHLESVKNNAPRLDSTVLTENKGNSSALHL